ncbi:hypothetical protein GCM10020219_066570 [Nonomuraea dietziae]
MDCGKSTLALQMNYNHGRQGRRGLVLTKHDRSGGPKVTSRIGLGLDAIEVDDSLDLVELVRGHDRIDYLICDEACFYTMEQIEQLADLVDGHGWTSTPSAWPPTSGRGCSPPRSACSSWPTRCAGCRSRCCAGAGGQGC